VANGGRSLRIFPYGAGRLKSRLSRSLFSYRQDAKDAELGKEEMVELLEPDKQLDSIMHDVIGAAIEVHRYLGPGLLEAVYEKALCLELTDRRIKYDRQLQFDVKYKPYVVGQNRLDLLVENEVVVEIKTVETLAPIHTAQIIAYLKCTGYRLGLLVNFNVVLLKQGLRRIILS